MTFAFIVFPVALVVIVLLALRQLPIDFGYTIEGEFGTVPADDEALTEWLHEQTGVYSAVVTRRQVNGHTRVRVQYGITRNVYSSPPLPNLEEKCQELGYVDQISPFRDSLPD